MFDALKERIALIKQTNKDFDAANKIIEEINDSHTKPSLEMTNIDWKSSSDRHIALELLLRGKSEKDYFSIINGLMEAHDVANGEEKKKLLDLTSAIMSIGENNLGIDWS